MADHELGFQLSHGLKGYTDYDDYGCTGECNVHLAGSCLRDLSEDDRENGDDTDEQRADKGDPGEFFLNIVRRGFARTDAGDGTVVPAECIGHLDGVVLDRTVEIAEEHDQDEVQDAVEPALGIKQIEERSRTLARILDEHLDCGRKGENGAGEDDGHDAGDIDLDGKVRILAAVHLSAYDALCINDRNTSLGVVEPDDEHDHGCHENVGDRNECIVESASLELLMVNHDVLGETGDDTGEKENRDTVADTFFVDLLTQPHEKCGAGGKGENNDQSLKDRGETMEHGSVGIQGDIAIAS